MATAAVLGWQISGAWRALSFSSRSCSSALAGALSPPRRPGLAQRAQPGLEALPAAARAQVSTTLGQGDRSYRARTTARGLTLASPPQNLEAAFAPDGVSVAAGGANIHLSLRSLGYGDALRRVAPAVPEGRASRVVYRRGALVEWYANGPLGVEQGFTLASPPAAPRTGPLTLQLRALREPLRVAGRRRQRADAPARGLLAPVRRPVRGRRGRARARGAARAPRAAVAGARRRSARALSGHDRPDFCTRRRRV